MQEIKIFNEQNLILVYLISASSPQGLWRGALLADF